MEIIIKGDISIEQLKLLVDKLNAFFITDFQVVLELDSIRLVEN